MVKTIMIEIKFIGEGEVKTYKRTIDNFGASDFPTIKEVKTEMDLMLARFNVDASIDGTSDL